jgi:hypothetical protein
MTRQPIENQLRDIADFLKSGFDWASGGPYHTRLSMPGRHTRVVNVHDETIAVFSTRDMPPSCPVSPRDIEGAKLLAEVLNTLAKKEADDINPAS